MHSLDDLLEINVVGSTFERFFVVAAVNLWWSDHARRPGQTSKKHCSAVKRS